jgi:hypothetical protein
MRIRSRRANTERAPIPSPGAWVAGGLTGVLLFVAAGAAPAGGRSGSPPLQALVATPNRITLCGPYAQARVLVEGRFGGGAARDVSGEVALAVADPRVAAADAEGMVRPRRDGRTTLIARLRGRETQIPVEVRGVANARPPCFLTDVLPVLTKAGCNQGACHGAQQGKGGFKLSLLGYDPDADYQAITRASGGRRVSVVEPDNSLILRKPTLGVAHKGGKRFEVGSPQHRLLRDWILAGLPAPARVPASRRDLGASEAATKDAEPAKKAGEPRFGRAADSGGAGPRARRRRRAASRASRGWW